MAVDSRSVEGLFMGTLPGTSLVSVAFSQHISRSGHSRTHTPNLTAGTR
jgi:hypothetical protein